MMLVENGWAKKRICCGDGGGIRATIVIVEAGEGKRERERTTTQTHNRS